MASGSSPAEARYTLWISDRDEEGGPVDPQFIQAAYALEPALFSYRRRELGCESVAAGLIQSAVNSASCAAHSEPIGNPTAYLWTVFTRRVDKYLANSALEVAVEDAFIEDLSVRSTNWRTAGEVLDQKILFRELTLQMDVWTRRICNMRLTGFSNEEIARELGEPANRVAVRYWRGLKRAARLLSNLSSDKRQSRG